MRSAPVFSEVRVARSLVFCVMFVDSCLSFSFQTFGHYIVCPSIWGRRGHMVVGFTTTCAISAYHH
jgi:hypothetical protein